MVGVAVIIEDIYKRLRSMAIDRNITAGNVAIMASQIMELVEKYPELTGQEKQKIVIQLMKRMTEESELGEEQKRLVSSIIDIALPNIINVVIKATHGLLEINKHEPQAPAKPTQQTAAAVGAPAPRRRFPFFICGAQR